ncbi:MAG: DUF4058 family protein [Gemmataceae bacterium]
MPIHDWTRVDAGIFHAFHHSWIDAVARTLNVGLLPPNYYALPEQFTSGFGPDVLTLEMVGGERPPEAGGNGPALLAPPRLKPIAETDLEFYRRKQKVVAIHHVSDDEVVAVVEIVSPGNKAGRKPMRAFVDKVAALLEQGVHLLVIDLFPPGPRDPNGIHGAVWEEMTGEEYAAPKDKPLTLAAYEAGLSVRAYVEHAAVGAEAPEMPLFLEWNQAVSVPLQQTYDEAYTSFPKRWKRVLEA